MTISYFVRCSFVTMKRDQKPKSKAIHDYYEGLIYSVGKTSKSVATEIGMTAVNFCNLTYKLDMLSGEKIELLAKALGVEPVEFYGNLLKLRRSRKLN